MQAEAKASESDARDDDDTGPSARAIERSFRARQRAIAKHKRPARRRTGELYRAAIEFFDDPDNHDLVRRSELEWWFKDALDRFEREHAVLTSRYTLVSVRRILLRARTEARAK